VRLHASVIVSNYGTDSVIIRSVAYSMLPNSGKRPPIRMQALLSGKLTDTAQIVIEGRKSLVVDYYSEKLSQLDKDATEKKIPLVSDICKAGPCFLYVARSRDGKKDELKATSTIQIGTASSDSILKSLPDSAADN